jgi:hypothetical protein
MTNRTREIAARAAREIVGQMIRPPGSPDESVGVDVDGMAVAIEAAIREAEQGRWVPVEERLPEENENALVTHGDDITIGWIDWADSDGAMWWTTDGPDEDGPTHWQPLPSPPEETEP